MKPDPSSSVKSADRTLDILEYVGHAPERPSFSEMLAELGIPRSSLFHLLNNLLARGYLEQDPVTDRYRLGCMVRSLAKTLAPPPIANLAESFLRELTGELNESSAFYVRKGDAVEAIAVATSTRALTYTMKVGGRAPLYAISSGKMTLARMPADEFDDYLRQIRFDAVTPSTITSKRVLREQVALARTAGFAYSRDEFTPGITGIATAVEHEGRYFGALNLAIPNGRYNPERDAEFRQHLASAAATLAETIAGRSQA